MAATDEYKTALQALNDYIWVQGYRHTAERETILYIICRLKQPFTVDQVKEQALSEHISPATVYNCMQLFDKAGIIHLLQSRSRSKSEWELITGHRNRLQLICKRCGRVADFKDVAITNAVKLRKYSNFEPDHFTIFVYGECKHCRK